MTRYETTFDAVFGRGDSAPFSATVHAPAGALADPRAALHIAERGAELLELHLPGRAETYGDARFENDWALLPEVLVTDGRQTVRVQRDTGQVTPA